MGNLSSCTRCGNRIIDEEFETHICELLPKFVKYVSGSWGGNLPQSLEKYRGLRFYGITENGEKIALPYHPKSDTQKRHQDKGTV